MEDAYSRVNSPPYKHNRSQREAVKQRIGYQHLQRGLVIAKFCQHFASQPSSLPSPSPCKISSVCGFKVCHSRVATAGSKETGICYSEIGHSRVLTKTFASANCIPFEISPPCLLSATEDTTRTATGGRVRAGCWLARCYDCVGYRKNTRKSVFFAKCFS